MTLTPVNKISARKAYGKNQQLIIEFEQMNADFVRVDGLAPNKNPLYFRNNLASAINSLQRQKSVKVKMRGKEVYLVRVKPQRPIDKSC